MRYINFDDTNAELLEFADYIDSHYDIDEITISIVKIHTGAEQGINETLFRLQQLNEGKVQ